MGEGEGLGAGEGDADEADGEREGEAAEEGRAGFAHLAVAARVDGACLAGQPHCRWGEGERACGGGGEETRRGRTGEDWVHWFPLAAAGGRVVLVWGWRRSVVKSIHGGTHPRRGRGGGKGSVGLLVGVASL